MKNGYSDQELFDQLQQSLAEGESWHIEFKDYNFNELDTKIVEKWRDDLACEFAGLASKGGKIYLGITNDGTVNGIVGTHQVWQEKLLERAVGKVRPKISWKSYYFTNSTNGVNLIMIDLLEGEPIYYVNGKPYLREGTRSRPAEPEEVKARFKEYFENREPLIRKNLTDTKDEQSLVASWIVTVLINILSNLNLYEQKNVNPPLGILRTFLESNRTTIENNLNKVKLAFGEESAYYKRLEAVSNEILMATRVEMLIDGGKSWSEWLIHLKKIYDSSMELLYTIRSTSSVTIEDFNIQEEAIKEKTSRWLNSIDDYRLSEFTYAAKQYVNMLLHLHFLFWLNKDEKKAKYYKEIADEIERLSWARTNVDYKEIIEALPKIIKKLKGI